MQCLGDFFVHLHALVDIHALCMVARRICTTLVDPSGLKVLVACRLVALDKCPGVRSIGIGEVARRIIAKAIARVLSHESRKLQVHYRHVLGICQAVKQQFMRCTKCLKIVMLKVLF